MDLKKITPLILTYNEEPNIDRTIKKLNWALQIIAIDSYSSDRTIQILERDKRVEIYRRKFDTHDRQWNYGLSKIKTEWVLSLDADYLFTDKLIEEIKNIKINSTTNGYFIPFKYCVFGKPLRGTILPPRQALFRNSTAKYINDGHTQLLENTGKSAYLKNYILHDDRKSLKRWLNSQDKYMAIEAQKLQQTPIGEINLADKIRKQKIIAPFIVFFYCLIWKQGIFDGSRGWYYAFQRMLAEIILSIKLIENAREEL